MQGIGQGGVRDRGAQAVVIVVEPPGRIARLVQRQQEQGAVAGRACIAVGSVVVQAAGDDSKIAIDRRAAVGAHAQLGQLRCAGDVADVGIVAVGEFPQHAALFCKPGGIGDIEREYALRAAAHTGHQYRARTAGNHHIRSLGRTIDVGAVHIILIGQPVQRAEQRSRHIGKQLGAIGSIEGVQHAIVGAKIKHIGPRRRQRL